MNKLTLKMKLALLGLFFICIILIIGFMGINSNSKLTDALHEVGLTQLPAVRTMTLIDMMHDGLKAVVFKAIYYSDTKELETKKEIAEELKEMTQHLTEYVESVGKMNLNESTKIALNEARPEVEKYGKAAEEIVALALSGKKDLIENKLKEFEDYYLKLEHKLEVLGDLIEKDSQKSIVNADKVAESLKQLNYLILLISFLISGAGIAIFSSRLSKSLKLVADTLSVNADQVASAATQIASSSQGLSQAATEQAASLEQTAASLEEITSMIAKATESAETTSETSSESQRKAEEGREAVDQMLTSMTEISQSNEAILSQINESNRQMTEIVRVIQDIGNRTKVINEIVFQTKLLSFNASVEAARAGEHGKGFAVVAEEVGNLAQMSGNAAKEITDMLDSSISKVEGIVKDTQEKVEILVQNSKEKVDSGTSVAQKCSDVLNEIVQNVLKVSGLSQEITQASKEQSQGVSEINKAMSQLDTVTQQNAATSEEAATAAEELSKQAESLKSSVSELMEVIDGKKKSSTSFSTGRSHHDDNTFSISKKSEERLNKETKIKPKNLQAVSGDYSSTPDADHEGFRNS